MKLIQRGTETTANIILEFENDVDGVLHARYTSDIGDVTIILARGKREISALAKKLTTAKKAMKGEGRLTKPQGRVRNTPLRVAARAMDISLEQQFERSWAKMKKTKAFEDLNKLVDHLAKKTARCERRSKPCVDRRSSESLGG